MKNREKYADEIKNWQGKDFCGEFIKPIILKKENCCGMGCQRCRMLQLLWLEEEYTEPEIDWSKITVDTPILVRNSETGDWRKRYFAKFKDGKVYAWFYGKTSWTSDEISGWEYAKLAEREDSDE